MSIGAGLSSQLGAKKETVYGTAAVPVDKFFEYESEGVNFVRNRVESKGLRAGRTFQSSARVATTTRGGEGPITMEVPIKGFGFWPDLLVQPTITPLVVETTAYKSTYNVGASDADKSATIQVGKPGTAGTVHPFTYEGCVVTAAKLSCAKDGFLMYEQSVDVQDRLTATALATASYTAANDSFHFGHCAPTVNSVAITDKFESVNIDMSFARKTDRWFLGAAGAKAKPITNAYAAGTIEFGGEFKDLSLTSLYDADTIFPVIVSWTHTQLAGATAPYSVTVTAAACQMAGDDPNVSGPDVLSQGMKCTVLDDGTNPPLKIEVVALDTAAW